VTGLDDGPPFDHELLASCTGQDPADVTPFTFGPPVSPHLAATLDPAALLPLPWDGTLVVEGVGGLLVPLTPTYSVRDLAVDVGLPLVVATRTGLGTINHTLLTLEAARASGLDVALVVLGPWPGEPSRVERSNRETIGELGGVPVATIPRVDLTLGALSAAGEALLAVCGDLDD